MPNKTRLAKISLRDDVGSGVGLEVPSGTRGRPGGSHGVKGINLQCLRGSRDRRAGFHGVNREG